MKHVNIQTLLSAVPVRMTRKEKLKHWAKLVYNCRSSLLLFHNLEYASPQQLRSMRIDNTISAFSLAATDPVLQSEGLKSDGSVSDLMGFFELSQNELHEFSCDCGGSIDNLRMAGRISEIADRRK